MKLIKQTKLFFREKNSDKVYEIDLCEVGEGRFVVNFRYGKRGTQLKEGTKTEQPTDQANAEKIFAELESEKRKKGYKTQEENTAPKTLPNYLPNTPESALLQRLSDEAQGKQTFKTKWKLSRVIWQVGVRKMKEAVPYLIELEGKGDTMQQYALVWALARCAEAQAIPTLKKYFENDKHPLYLRKIAQEGLIQAYSPEERATALSLNKYKEKIPVNLQEPLKQQNAKELYDLIQERLQETQPNYIFLEQLYTLALQHTWLSKIIAQVIKNVNFKPPFFQHLRAIYKIAELREDAIVLGALFYQVEKQPALFNSIGINDKHEGSRWYFSKHIEGLGYIDTRTEIKKKDTKIAFSDKTKLYFLRRSLKKLSEIGEKDPKKYLQLATSILLQYKPTDTIAAYRTSTGYPRWNSSSRDYTHTITNFPSEATNALLRQILFGNDDRYHFSYLSWRFKEKTTETSKSWYIDPTTKTIETNEITKLSSLKKYLKTTTEQVENQRKELYPQHWDSMPQVYVQLLLQCHLDVIHAFACKNLYLHPEYKQIEAKIDHKTLQMLLSSPYEIPVWVGLNIAKQRLDVAKDNALVLLLLNASSKDAREKALQIIAQNIEEFVRESNFVNQLLFSQHNDVQLWAKNTLTTLQFSEEALQIMIGKAISEILSMEYSLDKENTIAVAVEILKKIAMPQLEKLSWNIVEELLRSDFAQSKHLASVILVAKSAHIPAQNIPFKVIHSFLESPIAEIRSNGMKIFAQYPESILIESASFIGDMLLSPFTELRTTSEEIVKKMITKSEAFASQIFQTLIQALIRKPTYEGVHQKIAQTINESFRHFLPQITLKQAWKLVHSHYRPSQEIGLYAFQNHIQAQDLTLRQVIALANHELLAVRNFCWNFYQQNIARIKYEREEALRLLDAKWDDTREFAIKFFDTQFEKKDWDLDSLISIVDSVRPDIEAFGKSLITRFFEEKDGATYLTKLSQHPSQQIQLFTTNYLEQFATNHTDRIKSLDFYFRSVLTRVNKIRVAKNRIIKFLHQEALKSEEVARFVTQLLNDMVATQAIQDKARFIEILSEIKHHYPHIKVALSQEVITQS
ncbi:MAG: WGR domain-containing protein [Cytophagales bacterium]|nr:MAG: WGR domain-containing protein [Cytophagales bacterium]